MISCKGNQKTSKELIAELQLKTGQVVTCGPPGKEFGTVDFKLACNENVKADFNTAIELLHSFEYDEAEKAFASIIAKSPDCAMAYWGVAMCNFHPLWEPPTVHDLKKGSAAIAIAKSILGKPDQVTAYIDAVDAYYKDWDKTNALVRAIRFEKAMEQLRNRYPDDEEASIFYALALDASASPTDKTYANQRKAGEILNALYLKESNHPGIIHYIIHTFDYPGIAQLGLAAARRYAQVAPSSAHALHMPSHIFTRLGLWDDCIQSNTQSVASAQCYAQSTGIQGHWDEELHGLDYLVYAYLQKGNNQKANELSKYVDSIREIHPVNLKSAYTFAAVPSRLALENKNWKAASTLPLHPVDFPWNRFPWQESLIHFARLLGDVNLDSLQSAENELSELRRLHDTLISQNEKYRANQVAIQIKAGEAWIRLKKGDKSVALAMMKLAADMEDSTSKHPVTPGEVLPARELYGDMLYQMNQYKDALIAYEGVLQKSPNRFNALYDAAQTASKLSNLVKASSYYKQLINISDTVKSDRMELSNAKIYLAKHH